MKDQMKHIASAPNCPQASAFDDYFSGCLSYPGPSGFPQETCPTPEQTNMVGVSFYKSLPRSVLKPALSQLRVALQDKDRTPVSLKNDFFHPPLTPFKASFQAKQLTSFCSEFLPARCLSVRSPRTKKIRAKLAYRFSNSGWCVSDQLIEDDQNPSQWQAIQ